MSQYHFSVLCSCKELPLLSTLSTDGIAVMSLFDLTELQLQTNTSQVDYCLRQDKHFRARSFRLRLPVVRSSLQPLYF